MELRVEALAVITTARAVSLSDLIDRYEKEILIAALELTDGNRLHASQLLKISRTCFFMKMQKYGLCNQFPRERGGHNAGSRIRR